MRKEGEQSLKPGQAALIVTYGNTTRKHRPLDRDLIVLGRTPACDVTLVSPEVAAIHCIIQRTSDGWRIRDCCGGRHATRLNGQPIHEEMLRDTDVVQIGTFSFEARLPAARATPVLGNTPVADERLTARLKRLQRARRKLVHLALHWRQRARKNQPLPPSLAELERQAESLRGLQRDYQTLVEEYETRLDELEKAEREVCDERSRFERECTERQTRLDKAEHELARRQAELTRVQVVQTPVEPHADAPSDSVRLLDRRSQELNHFARYLRRCRQELREQRLPTNPVPAARNGEREHWREQCEQLQAEWVVLENRFQEERAALKAERDKIRLEADALASTVKELQVVAESLRREIHDRDVVLQKLRRQMEQQPAPVNLEHSGSYERELNDFRLQLERDRGELNEQLCQLQARQAEMETAGREAELQMSRERAVIARERAELTRMRDEIRIARERTTREGSVRDRLSRINRLKQELAGLSASAPGDLLRTATERVTADPARASADRTAAVDS
jgi:pSer/pThr/pTyr-binding forkhead associated (FHA) protein